MAAALSLGLLLACAARVQVVGVLASGEADPAGGARPVLTQESGAQLRLVLDAESAPLRHLEACTVQVEGPRLGHRVLVRDWSVLAAADGSAPYVGTLELHGSNLILRDRNSGSILVLEERSAAPLRPFVGQPVLVIGYVEAAHVVRVMGWRVLVD